MKKNQKGFSLIELLIVVAIILIIAAIAIPNLLRARIAANEASAVGSTRTIVTAEISYTNSFQIGPTRWPTCRLRRAVAPERRGRGCGLLDRFEPGRRTKSGYNFASGCERWSRHGCRPNTGFESNAMPITVGTSGQRSFCADMSGVLHFNWPARLC